MKNIKEAKKLSGKRVLLRVDFNVPVENGAILDDFRIKRIIPTIQFLQKKKTKIILLSHTGRDKKETLKPVYEYLKKDFDIFFAEDIFGDKTAELIDNMKDGQILMLENLRKYDGEKNNDEGFAKKLASLGDIYVNESFATSHRSHASIVGIPKFLPSYSGILFNEEIKELSKSFKPTSPSVFILGGDKFETKLPLINKMVNIVDFVFVGGALANNFFREKGFSVGKSSVSKSEITTGSLLKNKKIILPVDVVVKKGNKVKTKYPNEVLPDEIILDAGSETILKLKEILTDAKFILFNGPLGDYKKGFNRATSDLTELLANSKAETIVGGGDTVAVVRDLKMEDKIGFLSTGGGAMIKFLAEGTLVGIEALNN